VYAARATIYTAVTDAYRAVQGLVATPGTESRNLLGEENQLEATVWAHAPQLASAVKFNDVIMFDTSFGTNIYDHKLLIIVGVNGEFKYVPLT
jgi:hypothetical protein